MKPHFSQEKWSLSERYRLIPEFVIEHDKIMINKLNWSLTEEWDYVMPLFDLLLIVLPAWTWNISGSFIMLLYYIVSLFYVKNKKVQKYKSIVHLKV